MLPDQLINFCLHLADNSLIMGHRLSEWAGHGPMLEQDIALSNIALDLIGQSRYFYQYAASLKNSLLPFSREKDDAVSDVLFTEDALAYLREANEFKNIILVELSNGDWAKTILKLFFFSAYQYLFYEKLVESADKQLAAIAEKSLKEVTYHLRWSSEWVIRFGDGTQESHRKIKSALHELWDYTNEMFIAADYEAACTINNIAVEVATLKIAWDKKVHDTFAEATLPTDFEKSEIFKPGGKQGLHTEHLREVLVEMQYLQRTYPGCEW